MDLVNLFDVDSDDDDVTICGGTNVFVVIEYLLICDDVDENNDDGIFTLELGLFEYYLNVDVVVFNILLLLLLLWVEYD